MLGQSYPVKESRVLWRIPQGILVYDYSHCYVGTVNYVRTSLDLAEEQGNMAESSLAHIPTDARRQMLREGFVQVEGDSADYYIAPTQVCEVQDNQLILNVRKAEIMRF